MNGKAKRFPLSLSSVVEPSARISALPKSFAINQIATPQTATQNAANHAAQSVARQGVPKQAGGPFAPKMQASAAPLESERQTPLVSDSVRHAMVARLAKQGIKDATVLEAMGVVQRHLFMEPGFSNQAYVDASIPIGHQQTISQPYIVARMIEVLRNGGGGRLNRVLEVGTGCGYQAAVLSLVAKEVYSIERIKPLHELARQNLRPMRIANIRLHYGDGMLGLQQSAPFDGIILAAAGIEVPQPLLEQMTIGGRLVAPVGARQQVLQLIERVSKLEWTSVTLEGCHFVPLRPGIA